LLPILVDVSILHTVPNDAKNFAKLSNENGKVKAKVINTQNHFLKTHMREPELSSVNLKKKNKKLSQN